MSKSKVSLLPFRVLGVHSRKERIIEEDLFTLHPLDVVLCLVLFPIPGIPFKPDYLRQELQNSLRNMYIDNIYIIMTLSRPHVQGVTQEYRIESYDDRLHQHSVA